MGWEAPLQVWLGANEGWCRQTEGREEDQRVINLVGESLRLLGNIFVALSDLRCNLACNTPRHLHVVRPMAHYTAPMVLQQAAIPIQVSPCSGIQASRAVPGAWRPLGGETPGGWGSLQCSETPEKREPRYLGWCPGLRDASRGRTHEPGALTGGRTPGGEGT